MIDLIMMTSIHKTATCQLVFPFDVDEQGTTTNSNKSLDFKLQWMQNPYPRTNIHNTIHSRIELVRIAQT